VSTRRVQEAVFSSIGFRIRAAHGQTAKHGFAGWTQRVAATLFFTVFPADCRICDAPLLRVSRLPVCESCLIALRPLKGSYCTVCGEALRSAVFFGEVAGSPESAVDSLENSPRETRCMLCQRARLPFERAVAYGSYDGGLRDLVHLLKFQQVRPAAAVLGRMLAETIANLEQAIPDGKIAVVPVPLHKRKLSQREFNQAEMIARAALGQLSRPKRLELCTGVLLRKRETASQIGLTRHQRRANLRGAFVVEDSARIVSREVLLIDDVYTTGTTAAECARVLRKAGAARVWVAIVARTLKLNDVFVLPSVAQDDLSDGRSSDDLPEDGSEGVASVAAHG
jgi:ComF family protein